MNERPLADSIKFLVLALVLFAGGTYVQAVFSPPSVAAPGCPDGAPGCDAPLNASALPQAKLGSISLNAAQAPDSRASLDLQGSGKGILLPRLTTAQRDSLASAPDPSIAGLSIYNTDTSRFEVFDGTVWNGAVAAPTTCSSGAGCSTAIETGLDAQSKQGSLGLNASTTPNAKASLDLRGTNKGFLPPRLTTTQRDALTPSPDPSLQGLLVYNSTLNELQRYDGSSWGSASGANSGPDGPAFMVHRNGVNTTLAGLTDLGGGSNMRLVPWTTEEFDTHNTFANNTFTPTVPGKYVLTATLYFSVVPQGNYIGAAIFKNGVSYKVAWSRDLGAASNVDDSVTVTAVVDANGTTDNFKVGAYYGGIDKTLAGNINSTYFSGTRIGGPATVTATVTTTTNNIVMTVPAGAVMFFNLASCPGPSGADTTGWRAMDGTSGTIDMRGMYPVGAYAGSVGSSPAVSRLGNLENRPTGYHTISLPAMTAAISDTRSFLVNTAAGGGTPAAGNYVGAVAVTSYTGGQFASQVAAFTSRQYAASGLEAGVGSISGSTPAQTLTAGSISGTNAPYVQLLACQKI